MIASLTPQALETYGINLSKQSRSVKQLIDAINFEKRKHQLEIAHKPVDLNKPTRRKTGGKRKPKKRKTAKRRYAR